jgi:hypothetical protein
MEWSLILGLAVAHTTVFDVLLMLCSLGWHIEVGTALIQLLLIVAADGDEWSDLLCCNHFSVRQKKFWYPLNMKLGCPLNQSEYLVEIKNCIYLQGI